MKAKRKKQPFSISRYLATTGPDRSALGFQAGQAIFCQGDTADAVYYIRRNSGAITPGQKADISSYALLRLDHIVLDGVTHQRTHRMDFEFAHDMGTVRFRSLDAYCECDGDFLAAFTLG
jgi:hypothetical protein